jgi:alpha-D-xyloside xylohydrolase
MKFIKTITTGILTCVAVSVMAADYTTEGQYVTIPVKQVKAGGAQVVRLQVVNDNIIRVQATSEA